MQNSFELKNNFYNKLSDILYDIDFVKKGKKELLSNVASVFDIEASSFYKNETKQGCMYAWVFGINGRCIRGRTWEEFDNVLQSLINQYDINLAKRFVIYVHNLSYEFQWIKHRFKWYKVFSLESRKPVYAITEDGIEFRCSYILSGFSLAVVGRNLLKYKVEKMEGDLDYRLIRHSKTPLNDKEWGYILNDGLVVMAYIQEEIERLGTIVNIPMTKTGYVRNLCRENCLKGPTRIKYNKLMKRLILDSDDYNQLKRTYAGGYTHANHNKVDKILYNIGSADETSAYPAVMVSEKYPMSESRLVVIKDKNDFVNKLNKYCCMFDIVFYNLKSKFDYEHYISKSKCSLVEGYLLDNGRIIEADKLRISITEQDFFIIHATYEWDYIDVGNFKIYDKQYLPKDLILSVLQLYHDKTTLKDVEGKEAEYLGSKGMINSVYGMTVTDPCKDDIIYDNTSDWNVLPANIDNLIKAYNYSNNRFLYYPWGVWITAYARKNLWSAILEFKEDYVYSDTDSIKGENFDKHKKYFEEYNIKVKDKIKKCLKYHNIPLKMANPKTIKGVEKPLGVWDYEGMYDMFKTLGAKRYMFVKDGKFSITISGVKKTNGADYLLYKYKTFDKVFKAFKDELIFPAEYEYKYIDNKTNKRKKVVKSATGKLTHTYLDVRMKDTVIDYLGNECEYSEYSGVHMEPAAYELSLDATFKKYLLGIKQSYIC